MKWISLSILCFFFTDALASTERDSTFVSDSLLAIKYYNIADSSYKNVEKSFNYAQLALPLLKATEQWEKYIYVLLTKSYLYEQLEEFDEMFKNNRFALEETKRLLPPKHPYLQAALTNLGYVHSVVRQDYEKAKQMYKFTLASMSDQNDSTLLIIKAALYENIGFVAQKEGDFASALDYFDQAYQYFVKGILSTTKDTASNIRLAAVMNNQARLNFQIKNYQLAVQLLLRAINKIKINQEPLDDLLFKYYSLMAEILLEWDNPDEAVKYLNEMRKIKETTVSEQVRTLKLEGLLSAYRGNYNQTVYNITRALKLLPAGKKIEHSELQHLLGEIYEKQQDYEHAIEAFQEGLRNLVLNPPNQVNAVDFSQDLRFRSTAVAAKLMISKAAVYKNWYLVSKDQQHLKLALQEYRGASLLSDRLRQDYETEEAKLFLGSQAADFYENALAVAKSLYKQTGNVAHIDEAFYFMEKSKSAILLDEIRMKKVRMVPEPIRVRVKQYKVELNYIEKQLYIEKHKTSPDPAKLQLLEDKVFTIKQDQLFFTDSLKFLYPNFYRIREDRVLSVKEVRDQLLSADQVLIEYFVGKDKIYVLKVSRDEVSLTDLEEASAFKKLVNTLLDHKKLNGRDALNEFSTAAEILYQKLIQPLNLTPGKKLIIIPDGILGYLPFEILQKTRKPGQLPKAMDFLIRNHQISYAYSATLLGLQNNTPAHPARSLGIFPVFENTDRFLPNSTREMNFLKDINACILERNEANIANFRDTLVHFDLIHLSTHAVAEDSILKQPAFYLIDSIFYLSDLYTLNIPAHLVVLSACETGLGKHRNGEGMMSLARGFTYAGVPGILTTLWQVSDQTTAEIINSFYQNLKLGMTKDKALYRAKMDYLDQCPDSKSAPYYWAGIIHIGNSSTMEFKHSPQYLRWLMIPFLLGLILFFLWLRKKA